MDSSEGVAGASPVPAWAVLATVGTVALALSVWNSVREVGAVGLGPGPVVTAVLTTAFAGGIVYASVALRGSALPARDEWTIVGAALGGGLFTTASQLLTMLVRAIEGRAVTEPLFPILVVGSLGTLGGVLIGQQYVRSRRDRRAAERSRDVLSFTNGLLRHDVRNDLQIVVGHVSLLDDHEDAQVRESAATIRSQTDSIERLLTEVESLTAVLTGDADTEPVDVVPIVTDVAETTAESYGDDVRVETDLPGELTVEGGDGLYSVFDNLVENAVQHGRNDGVRVRITGHATADDRAVVRVADDGPGIQPEDRDRVFDRGVSEGGEGGEGGHGLYVARIIVEAFDGDVVVDDSELGGAAVTVTLPLAEHRNT